ncbi:ADP-glyceromanno-heptose 6-epimerase [Notoacmeibacter marinus]|uniref:ADP-glyceromanno-heptose 6-epimerase n=1 Tax=Notoacmeibacter marinus TaxID=1876515 RepID=UPI000DF33A30|nr:ADP-glyceromanno-heptose 6-epimerase [Notoacmeibacter marinus]
MIVVTGAAGFIGSNILAELEDQGEGATVACDWLGTGEKWRNLAKRQIAAVVTPDGLEAYLNTNASRVRAIFHMGAISDTNERDVDRLVKLNIMSTIRLWDWCAENKVRFIYASSAATYGALETGLVDDESLAEMSKLCPLNAYGWSKKATDEIILKKIANGETPPPQWAGFKFFNVYGPNEYHKGHMQSVIAKIFDSVRQGRPASLFRSERSDIPDGEQRRDFIYVKDCCRAAVWLLKNSAISGIFNIGTGCSISFLDIVRCIGRIMGKDIPVQFIDMPENIRNAYQYRTVAEIRKIRDQGLDFPLYSLEDGVADYIQGYLMKDRYR